MNPQDFNYFQSRVSRFISGSQSRPLFGRVGSPKVTRFSRFIPKRSVPSQVLAAPATSEEDISASRGAVSSLGRLTLNLEVINNNLDRIKDVIINDYKETQETNKKELDDYRKRIANRGRVFGKKELGDKKSDILGSVRKYVGSFFSGTGGAIRALAAFNLLQGLMTGDPSKVIGPLLGIGLTYLPAIGAGIAGAVATSLVGKLFGGVGKAAAGAEAAGAAAGAGRLAGLGRLGGRAALVGGGLALASSIFNRPEADTQQQRLEDLTQQQKGLVDSQTLVPVPQDDLKRFERLNKKFEDALDFLLGKQKEQPQQRSAGSGGGGGGGAGGGISQEVTGAVTDPNVRAFLDVIAKPESGGVYNKEFGGALFSDYSNLRTGDVPFGRYQFKPSTYNPIAQRLGITDISPQSQDIVAVQYMKDLGVLDEIQSGNPAQVQSAIDRLKGSIWTGLQKYGGGEAVQYFQQRKSLGGVPAAPSLPPVSPVIGAAPRSRVPVGQIQQVPQVNVVPFTVPSDEPTPASNAVDSNDSTPSINTTHPENFLALYSKLMYQIV